MLGNPPYNAYAGVSPVEENQLIEIYKQGLRTDWGIGKYNLDELYVRFFRLAERRVAEATGHGVVCFITNFSYLRERSFVVMRRHLLGNFDHLWFDNLNGDSRETGKTTPAGDPDPSVFKTKQNKAGIRKGAAVGLLVRTAAQSATPPVPLVRYRELWGEGKREQLLDSLGVVDFDALYETLTPTPANRYSFRGGSTPDPEADEEAVEAAALAYASWPELPELAARPQLQGLDEDRQFNLIGIDREVLAQRMQQYFDPAVSLEALAAVAPGLTKDAAKFDARATREALLREQKFSSTKLVPYLTRPFDQRTSYQVLESGLWKRPRPDFARQVFPGNAFLFSRPGSNTRDEGYPMLWSAELVARDAIKGHAVGFSMFVSPEQPKKATPLFGAAAPVITANLSPQARAYLISLGLADLDQLPTAGLLWYHALAVGYSPLYRLRNADALHSHWPRIPLPASADALRASATLGQQVAALLSATVPVPGISEAPLSPWQGVGRLSVVPPTTTPDLALTAHWGRRDNGKVMPGVGHTEERPYTPVEREALEVLFAEHRLIPEAGYALVGVHAIDVYLNDTTRWTGLPAQVWNFTIGGYQVLKKWLSYREALVLGRSLTKEEARYVPQVSQQLLALLLLAPALDASYGTCAQEGYSWPSTGS